MSIHYRRQCPAHVSCTQDMAGRGGCVQIVPVARVMRFLLVSRVLVQVFQYVRNKDNLHCVYSLFLVFSTFLFPVYIANSVI